MMIPNKYSITNANITGYGPIQLISVSSSKK